MNENELSSFNKALLCVIVISLITITGMMWDRKIFKQENNGLLIENITLKLNQNSIKEKKDNIKQNLSDALSYLNPKVDPLIKEQIVEALITESKKQNLPPLLPLCIIRFESNFNPLVKNSIGATGLMQIIPKYHQDKIDKHGWKSHEVFFIENNILLGCEILREYFDVNGNDIGKALQRYVGAIEKKNAGTYIEDIISSYLSLDIIYFMNNKKILEETIENTEDIVENNETE